MSIISKFKTIATTLLILLLLDACGGSGGSSGPAPGVTQAPESGAPASTGDLATDGFNWFNFRRQQIGIPILKRNSVIDVAAQNHSNYLKFNSAISHEEILDKPGFTGSGLLERLSAVGYYFAPQTGYAYGEVILASNGATGAGHADELIAAIYHRFVIFEPMFKEAGIGVATGTGTYRYFTTDFATNNGLGSGLANGRVVSYPFANQTQVPEIFYSDEEVPDPVPNQNAVGFPISVHANINALLSVQQFTVQARGGLPLPVRLLSNSVDTETPRSAAAIIPLQILASGTVYEVQFTGSVDAVPIKLSWNFTTK